jgi:glycine/D-amino acid oxidase-like deaminating enzyme
MRENADVAVAGTGVVGLAIAAELLHQGLRGAVIGPRDGEHRGQGTRPAGAMLSTFSELEPHHGTERAALETAERLAAHDAYPAGWIRSPPWAAVRFTPHPVPGCSPRQGAAPAWTRSPQRHGPPATRPRSTTPRRSRSCAPRLTRRGLRRPTAHLALPAPANVPESSGQPRCTRDVLRRPSQRAAKCQESTTKVTAPGSGQEPLFDVPSPVTSLPEWGSRRPPAVKTSHVVARFHTCVAGRAVQVIDTENSWYWTVQSAGTLAA